MSGLFNITSVAGSSPAWILFVDDSSPASTADHVAVPLLGSSSNGAVYRVTGVPNGNTINPTDSVERLRISIIQRTGSPMRTIVSSEQQPGSSAFYPHR